MAVYRIRHTTAWRHPAPASAAWQVLHLRPRGERGQECLEFTLEIDPAPADLASRQDVFGNTRHIFSLSESHRQLSVTSRCLVRRDDPPVPMAGLTPPVDQIPALIDAAVLAGEFTLEQYRHASPLVPRLPEAAALADGLDSAGSPALDWIAALGSRIRERWSFDPTATEVSTPLADFIALGRGVCQDFAHLFLSCARQRGLPAAYVSGYLLTSPPPGKPRLVGADASHAWVSVFVPGTGWIDYDPTNGVFAGSGHIVVARGRDYADVSPTRGLYSGGGAHQLSVSVTVEPAD
jgi:transglutaminase-like putative cysteine protease